MKKSEENRQRISHGFGPVYDSQSRYLILGSFPSVKSREQQFYYGHPRNRFWPLMARLFEKPLPENTEEKRQMLSEIHVALYDVIEECSIIGSSDSSIRDVVVTDLAPVLETGQIEGRIFTNGGKAWELYRKYTFPKTGIPAVKLPSSSPANAAYSLDRLEKIWREKIFGI